MEIIVKVQHTAATQNKCLYSAKHKSLFYVPQKEESHTGLA